MKDKYTLKWLYARAKTHLPVVCLLSIMRSALTVLSVLFALTSRYVVDAAVGRDISALSSGSLKLLLIIAAQISIRLIGQWIESSVLVKLNIHIRSRLFSSILRRDYSSQSAYHSGDLMTRLDNDSSIVSSGIISLIPSVVALVVGLSYALFSLMRLDINFAFIFLFGGILLLIVISAFRGVMKKLHKNVQEAESKVRAFYQESISSLLMIKVFGIEKAIDQKSDALQANNFKAQMKRRNLSIFASSSLGFIFSIGSFYALVHSAYRLYLGAISFGTLTAIIQLVNQIQSPFAGLSGIMPQYYAILASAERIIEIENLPEEKASLPLLDAKKDYDAFKNISFQDVSFGYGANKVLENANLTIDKGDFAVIGGISGIGKSTLIKLLLGVITPQSGKIFIDINGQGIPAGKHSRPLFSYVPQGNLLLSGTIRDAVSLVRPDASDNDIMKAAEISCAAEFINQLPDGLDTYIGEKGFGLSEGQIQRLAIMRALLRDAPIILLDEATSALDEATESKLLENIKGLQSKTCIIISHKPAAFNICNKHIYIEDKEIKTK